MTTTTMDDATPRLRIAVESGSLGQTILSLGLGAAFTLALFLGMAYFGKITPTAPTASIEDLRAVSLPFEPPPPSRATPAEAESSAEITTVTGFDLSPSDSPVKIAVSPPNLDDLAPRSQVAPPAVIQIGRLHGEFKPTLGVAADLQHVYQRGEVDTPPTVLFRAIPAIQRRLFQNATVLRLTLLFVVETSGAITNVRISKSSGIPDVDTIVADTVQNDWGFSPAIKKGRKVRCLLEQPFRIELPHLSRFREQN